MGIVWIFLSLGAFLFFCTCFGLWIDSPERKRQKELDKRLKPYRDEIREIAKRVESMPRNR